MNRSADIRILMTTDAVGGVWTYACALASALAVSGADVHLVTTGPRPRADQRAMLGDDIRLTETDLALEWQDPEGNDVANARRVLARLEDETAPDIVHLNSFREAAFEWTAPVFVVAHSCVNSWALACDDTAWLEQPRWERYTNAVADGLNRAQAWISPSCAFYETICDLYHPRSPGAVIWNGVAAAPVQAPKDHLVLAAGRLWDRAKNIVTLTAAADDLQWPLVIAGPADDPASAAAAWLGSLPHDDLLACMQRAAIFVSPARYEPFGLSVLEAASAGCALVLSDIPTFRELWSGAALFVDPMDTSGLRHAINALCTDHHARTRLQQAARRRAGRYSLAGMTSAYRQLYQSLLATRQRSAPARATEVHA